MRELKYIKESLNGDFHVVSRVDHPFLITPPDLLVATPGKLLAMFIPHYAELRSPGRLLSRLAFSRLAFPPNTYCVLGITERVQSANIVERLSYDFDELIDIDRPQNISSFIEKSPKKNEKMIGLNKLQQMHFARMDVILKATNLYLKSKEHIPYQEFTGELKEMSVKRDSYPSLAPTRYDGKSRKYRSAFHRIEDILISTTSFEKSVQKTAQIKKLCNSASRVIFRFDKGIPYPHNEIPILAVVDQIPSLHLDPLKLIRASAFANILITYPATIDQLVHIHHTVFSHLRKKDLV